MNCRERGSAVFPLHMACDVGPTKSITAQPGHMATRQVLAMSTLRLHYSHMAAIFPGSHRQPAITVFTPINLSRLRWPFIIIFGVYTRHLRIDKKVIKIKLFILD